MAIGDGREASAFLENRLLEKCAQLGIDAHVFTPGARYAPFVERYMCDGVKFSYLSSDAFLASSRWSAREAAIGQRLLRGGYPRIRRALWRAVGERLDARRAGELGRAIETERPDAVVTLNMTVGFDLGMIAVARRQGIPTLGNVFSWDHPFRPQRARADWITCWSDQIKSWLVNHGAFVPGQIDVVGAPAFDSYLAAEGAWNRKELCGRFGLNPARPILVFATLGQTRPMIDETDPFRELMAAVDAGRIAGNPQVVLRLHPLSVDYYFEEYRGRPDVVFSRYARYCPGMRWWPSREEMGLAGSLLRHADVCLSPGSTMAIEPSIFDTPTIVPVFNKYTTDELRRYFDSHWMDKHFRFLKDENLLPFAFSPDEMVDTVNRCLEDTTWMADGRETIRNRLLGPLDGNSTERFAQSIDRVTRIGR